MHCNGLSSMHLSVFDPFFTKNKPTGCSKASEGPKRHFIAQLGLFGAIRGPKWGPFEPKIVSNGLVSIHSRVFDPFPMKHKPTGWSKASVGPKGPIYGQMRALWGHQRPQFSVKLLFNGSSTMHSNLFDPFFIKHEPTCWSKTREGPKRSFRAKWGPFGLTYQTWKWRFLKIGSCELLVTS